MSDARHLDMTVAVTSELPGSALDRLRARCHVKVRCERDELTPERLAEFIGEADAAITLLANPVTAVVFERCPKLRVVSNYAVGYNNVDVAAAGRNGVWVTNTPDVLTDATADLTWALILAVTRRIVEGDRMTRSGGFDGWRLDLLLGSGLSGKTLGIIGLGRIGQAVARRAVPFGMRIAYAARRSVSGLAFDARHLPLDELLAQSDVVSLHCPLNDETRHLLDRRRLGLMRRGAYLINTARGPIVDEAALVEVLASGRLAGAGLDVYEREPQVHPGLCTLDNVVLVPHIGSATLETRAAMADLAVDNVLAVLDDQEPPAAVVRGGERFLAPRP